MKPTQTILFVLVMCAVAGGQDSQNPLNGEQAAALSYFEQGYVQGNTLEAQGGEPQVMPVDGPTVGGVSVPETFDNPILPGFHPAPSICRVEDDYYLVTASGNWFPGIPIYRSRDLINWEPLGHVLHRSRVVNSSFGSNVGESISSPTIRYHQGLFYVCAAAGAGPFYVTAPTPEGPWSDPIFLSTTGRDPSLFVDDVGQVWYVGVSSSSAYRSQQMGRVFMQALDLTTGRLTGPAIELVHGDSGRQPPFGRPHLYQVDSRYLLLLTIGETGSQESALAAYQAEQLTGPYRPAPKNPILTHQNARDKLITCLDQGDLVQTQKGDWWYVCQGQRLPTETNLMGQETFLLPVSMVDSWPVFNPGDGEVLLSQNRPPLGWHAVVSTVDPRDEFASGRLSPKWNLYCQPQTHWWSVLNRSGWLRMQLLPALPTDPKFSAIMARRVSRQRFWVETRMAFTPKADHECAGLILLTHPQNQYRLEVDRLAGDRRVTLKRVACGVESVVAQRTVVADPLHLGVEMRGEVLQFWVGPQAELEPLGGLQKTNVLLQPVVEGQRGTYVGMFASSRGRPSDTVADFDWFDVLPLPVLPGLAQVQAETMK